MKLKAFSKKENEKHASNTSGKMRGILSFAVAVVAVIFVMSIVFRVSNITVEGNHHYTSDEIINAIDIEEGDNLFFFDRFATISRVFAKLPYIEEISVERSLPGNVRITVLECTAMAYIEIGDEDWTIDHNCKVLGKATEDELSDLIPITGFNPGTLFIGESLTSKDGEEAVAYLADILNQIQDRGMTPKIARIDFTDYPSVKFMYGNLYTVTLGKYFNVERKFGMFVNVMEKLKSGDFGFIDLSDGSTAHFTPN